MAARKQGAGDGVEIGRVATGEGGIQLPTRRWVMGGLLAAALGPVRLCEAAVKAGDRPKTITVRDVAGAAVVLPDAYRGKVLALHFWASWCPSCFREMAALESLFVEYARRDFLPVSLNVGEPQSAVADALRRRPVTYPVLLDVESATARLYGVSGFPTTFLLDRRGIVGTKVLGEVDRDALRRLLERML